MKEPYKLNFHFLLILKIFLFSENKEDRTEVTREVCNPLQMDLSSTSKFLSFMYM